MYWSDSERSTIEVFSLDRKQRAVIHYFPGVTKPIGMILVPHTGKMFVALHEMKRTHIDILAMNGRGIWTHVIEDGIADGSNVFQFTVDKRTNDIYWIDGSQISYTNFIGDSYHIVSAGTLEPRSIAIVQNDLFWTNLGVRKLFWTRQKKFRNSKFVNFEDSMYSKTDEIQLLAIHSLAKFNHPCGINNGNCSHICTSLDEYRSSCVCPSGLVFSDAKNTTCIEAIDCEFRYTTIRL